MKRLLSLLVVIAMVVSLIPSVFAAKEEIDMDELLGRLVVLEDISLIEVKLAEGSDGMIYQWTPAADEEATELNLSWYPETAVLNVTATTGENTVSATTTEGFGELTLPIVAGQLVEIEVSEANGAAAEGYIYGALSGYPAGHESSPIAIGGPVEEVTIEKASWFQLYFTGDVEIAGEGAFNVIYEAETIAAVDGKVTIAATSSRWTAPTTFQIDAAGSYTVTFIVPVGAMENPAELVIGENVADIKAGSQGYFFTWIATEEGTLKITMPAGGWTYQLNNLTSSAYGDTQWSDSDPVVNPAEVAVAAGDEIQLVVNTYDATNPWESPAGQLTIKAELVLPEPPAPALTIVSQPESIIRNPGEAACFTVVAEGEGLTYKWYYRNAGETSWRTTSLTGYNTATLNVSNAVVGATHNGRQYMCKITAADGSVVETEPATLTVVYMVSDAKSQGVQIGETAIFTVKHSDPGATYRWQYKGNTSAATWANTSATGNKTDTLQVVAKATNNGYMYRCNITLSDGTVITSKEVYLNVVEDPATISANPVDTSVVSGDKAYFEIKAEGDGLVYQWQWSNDGVQWANTKSSGYNTAKLTVKTNNFMSGRYYRCVVKTYKGVSGGVTQWNKVYTEAAQLTVLPAADILETLPESVTVKVGENAQFHIGADGEGLTYQWQWAKFKGNWKNTSMTGATTDTLTVPGNLDYNGRYYRVVITNAYGGTIETAAVQLFVEQ